MEMMFDPNDPSLLDAVAALGALAQTHRLGVFRQLVRAGHCGLPAGVLAERLSVPRSSLSFHLSNLKSAGLVHERREGRSIIYSANFVAMRDLIAYLLRNCCEGDSVEAQLVQELTEGTPQ